MATDEHPGLAGAGAEDGTRAVTVLDVSVTVERPGFTLDASLVADAGELVVVLGPNGAGKSTLLAAIAGLVPAAGHVLVDGAVLLDSRVDIDRPPEDRPVGVVFQDGRLFPHLSVLDNVAFGLRCEGMRTALARSEARRWLERIGLADRATERPASLSGGQAQLVALARALAPRPRVLLLDEPLSALDAQARPAVRADLRRHLDSFPGARLLVTHDPVEALVLADRLVVVEDGRVVQVGSPDELRHRPRTPYTASVVGLNLWRGRGDGHRLVLDSGVSLVVPGPAPDGTAIAVVSPRAVSLHRRRPEGSPRNVVEGRIAGIEHRGDVARVQLDGPLPLVADVTAGALADLALRVGDPVWAAVKASEIAVSAET